jgi:hypothetical protein
LKKYGISGQLKIDASGAGCFQESLTPVCSSAIVELTDAKAFVPEWEAALDQFSMRARISRNPAGAPLEAHLERVRADSGALRLTMEAGDFVVDRQKHHWELARLTGQDSKAQRTKRLCPKKPQRAVDRIRPRGKLEFTAAANGAIKDGRACDRWVSGAGVSIGSVFCASGFRRCRFHRSAGGRYRRRPT